MPPSMATTITAMMAYDAADGRHAVHARPVLPYPSAHTLQRGPVYPSRHCPATPHESAEYGGEHS